jgi:hypothetical protein
LLNNAKFNSKYGTRYFQSLKTAPQWGQCFEWGFLQWGFLHRKMVKWVFKVGGVGLHFYSY